MTENFNYIFQYLEKENILVDKSEFLFQIQSHPDYPSVLAITDTLNFFNIQNGVIRVNTSEIGLLPNRYVTFLNDEKYNSQLYYIEKKGATYFYTQHKKAIEISESILKSKWNGIVLLAETVETENTLSIRENNLFWILPSLCLTLFLSLLFLFEQNLETKLFFIFPIMGILFSVAALKNLFGNKSELINSFCNISASTSCSTIIDSNKWKIFEFIDLSSLSIVFYTSQLVALFVFILSNNITDFFYIQKILIFSSIPIVFLSVYYQKFIEKKWCPICLVIVSILVLELVFLLVLQENNLTISLKSLVLFGFVFSAIAFIWTLLKTAFIKQKTLKEFQFEGNRFMRNYEVFKNSLISKDKMELPYSPIILGNKESNTEIAIITSPFCGHCKNAHEILDKIVIANKKNLKIKIIINADIDNVSSERKNLFRSLMSIYLEKGEEFFLEALHFWFNHKNLEDWIKIYGSASIDEKIDSIYKLQNQWCITNNLYLTPTIFINGYRYPRTYKRENLEFFVNELLDDKIWS